MVSTQNILNEKPNTLLINPKHSTPFWSYFLDATICLGAELLSISGLVAALAATHLGHVSFIFLGIGVAGVGLGCRYIYQLTLKRSKYRQFYKELIESIEKQVTDRNQNETNILVENVKKLTSELNQKVSDLNSKFDDIKKLENEGDELQAKLDQFEKEYRNQTSQQKPVNVENEKIYQNKINELEQQLSETTTNLRNEVDVQTQKYELLEKVKQELELKLNNLDQDLQNQKKSFSEFSKIEKVYQDKINELEQQLTENKDRVESQRKNSEETINDLKERLFKKDEEYQTLEKLFNKVSSEKTTATWETVKEPNKEKNELVENINNLNLELEKLTKRNNYLENKIIEDTQEITKLNDENGLLKEKLHENKSLQTDSQKADILHGLANLFGNNSENLESN